ncbi:MAG: hypothetical protein WBC44_06120 [Planctomycetaceae bacterium]
MRTPLPPAPRHGLTVYEVFLALTLLLGALAVLSQHISLGSRAGVRGRLQTQAAIYGETKLNEVIGGVEPLAASSGLPIAGAPAGWTWSLDVMAGPAEDLLDLTVTTTHVDLRGQTDASFTLRRLMRDPQMLLDQAAAAATAASASTTTSSSTSGGSTP